MRTCENLLRSKDNICKLEPYYFKTSERIPLQNQINKNHDGDAAAAAAAAADDDDGEREVSAHSPGCIACYCCNVTCMNDKNIVYDIYVTCEKRIGNSYKWLCNVPTWSYISGGSWL